MVDDESRICIAMMGAVPASNLPQQRRLPKTVTIGRARNPVEAVKQHGAPHCRLSVSIFWSLKEVLDYIAMMKGSKVIGRIEPALQNRWDEPTSQPPARLHLLSSTFHIPSGGT
jgi:hypothetical protein